MKIYNNKTQKVRLEQKEKEIEKKEIEKKRQENEQQNLGEFQKKRVKYKRKKSKMWILYKFQGSSCQTISEVYILIVVTVKRCQVFKALTRRTDLPGMSK